MARTKQHSRYRLYVWLMISSAVILAATLTIVSLKIIRGGRHFTQVIVNENRTFLVNTLRFGHGMMAHMGVTDYKGLIDLAMKSKFIRYLAILDDRGKVLGQSSLSKGLSFGGNYEATRFKDGKILKKTDHAYLISYKVTEDQINQRGMKGAPSELMAQMMAHMGNMGEKMARMQKSPKPAWFVVGLDVSVFRKHYRDMVLQTVGTGVAFLLFGVLVIVFFGIIQRYELAHLSIEKLSRIKRLLGYFVPETAKNMIEAQPGKKGLLSKYIQDATILFLDIEGFSLLVQSYPQERINRVVEFYFSRFLDVIQRNGGDINETAGDGMMVIFLDSDPGRHARNALRAAKEIRQACGKLPETEEGDLFPIEVNIGISSGKVYLGSTKMRASEGERWTFTASGAVTILAARLSQYAKKGQILISEETASRVEKEVSFRPLGKVTLKNIRDSGNVYELDLALP